MFTNQQPGITASYVVFFLTLFFCSVGNANAARCLYVSSYHQGYEWNDGIERGLKDVLGNACELKRFYMDSKNHPELDWAETRARAAVAEIKHFKPDVVIVADDVAVKYVLVNHFRDSEIPFVFCGTNWSVENYGEPYRNITGMVEVSPVIPLLKQIRRVSQDAKLGFFLSSQVSSEYQDFEAYKPLFASEGVTLYAQLVSSMEEWETAYAQAQRYDFIILGDNAGIADWDADRASQFALAQGKILSVALYEWMVPYSAIALTKLATEQGEWAAKAALAILDGMQPNSIPIIPNRRWQAWVNPAFIDRLGLTLPQAFLLKAREYQ